MIEYVSDIEKPRLVAQLKIRKSEKKKIPAVISKPGLLKKGKSVSYFVSVFLKLYTK